MAQLALGTELRWRVAGRTLRVGIGLGLRRLAACGRKVWRGEQGAGLFQLGPALSAPQAVGADFDKPFWQDVPQEAPDKFLRVQAHPPQLLRAVVPVTKGDPAVLKGCQAAVGDGDPKDVAAQVIQDLLARTGVLAMHHPLLLP